MSVEFLLIQPDQREGITTAAGGDVYSVLATGDQTNNGYYLTHAIVPAGGGPPPHIHTREEEAFYLISGTKHRFHNAGPEEVEMIFWFTPAGIEGLFAELFEHPENIVEAGQRYGTQYFFDE